MQARASGRQCAIDGHPLVALPPIAWAWKFVNTLTQRSACGCTLGFMLAARCRGLDAWSSFTFTSARGLLKSACSCDALDLEDELLAGERMVGVERDVCVGDFGDLDGNLLPVGDVHDQVHAGFGLRLAEV
jgi:hypothetical protein